MSSVGAKSPIGLFLGSPNALELQGVEWWGGKEFKDTGGCWAETQSRRYLAMCLIF